MAESVGRLPRLVIRVVGAAAALFYRVDRHGPALPPGPVIVAANHPNSLLDPVLVFRCSERATRPLARAPLFDKLLLGSVIRALGAIPVHRRQDDPDKMHLNEEMFRAAVDVLRGGGAIQVYPEGRSYSGGRLAEFRTGTARIALRAEAAADWRLGLSIVPVGITYSRQERARTAVVVRFGEAFACADLEGGFRRDPVAAAQTLTRRIEAAIRAQTLNFVHPGDRALVELAEQMYVREVRWVPWRARERLGTRFPRLQRFAAGLEWVRRESPDEHRALVGMVERYAALHTHVGAGSGDVPPRYGLVPVARYIAVRGTLLVAAFPLAAAGLAAWVPVTRLSDWVVKRSDPEFEVKATYKLTALLFGGALAWSLWIGLAYVASGALAAAFVAGAVPVCGYVAVQWLDLAKEVREDTALFLRLRGRPHLRERFARARFELVRAFRRVERRLLHAEEAASAARGGSLDAGPPLEGSRKLPSAHDRDKVPASPPSDS